MLPMPNRSDYLRQSARLFLARTESLPSSQCSRLPLRVVSVHLADISFGAGVDIGPVVRHAVVSAWMQARMSRYAGSSPQWSARKGEDASRF